MAERANPPTIEQELPDISKDAARIAAAALAEDATRDVTTEVVGVDATTVKGTVVAYAHSVVAGLPYATVLAEQGGVQIEWTVADGDHLEPGIVLGSVRGSFAAVMGTERALLNLLQRACGIATRTREFVDAVSGTGCRILHTRKTAPGLRAFDIRAVLAGGGAMNRGGLGRTVMVKDNHWRALTVAGREIGDVVAGAHERGLFCIVEVETREQVERSARAGADRLLVDNQAPALVAEWKEAARQRAPAIEIEASGGITLETVRAYAEAGADFVSVGALTHSVTAVDLGLDIAVAPDTSS